MAKEIFRTTFARLSSLKPASVEEADHDYFNAFLKSKTDIEKILPISLSDASVGIIGCGYKYADVLLYSCFAKEVYGLDVRSVFYRDGFRVLYDNLRKQGKGILYSLLRSFARRNGLGRYYERISELSALALKHADANLVAYDGYTTPFEDDKFDVVLSNAVLEHVLDLEGFFRELGRITKTGGLSYHLYHNYYSPSGAHLSKSLYAKHPWGHLRGIYETNPGHLNRATLEEVRREFSRVFEVKDVFQVGKDHSKKGVDEGFEYEGQEWLTEDIRKELANFSEEQLLTRSYLLVGTKG